ncbi:hypothetical protein ACJJTC_013345 [Scirpophaga incertulas]
MMTHGASTYWVRVKHETSMELVRTKELVTVQADTIAELERKLTLNANKSFVDSPVGDKSGMLRDVLASDRRDQAVSTNSDSCPLGLMYTWWLLVSASLNVHALAFLTT